MEYNGTNCPYCGSIAWLKDEDALEAQQDCAIVINAEMECEECHRVWTVEFAPSVAMVSKEALIDSMIVSIYDVDQPIYLHPGDQILPNETDPDYMNSVRGWEVGDHIQDREGGQSYVVMASYLKPMPYGGKGTYLKLAPIGLREVYSGNVRGYRLLQPE